METTTVHRGRRHPGESTSHRSVQASAHWRPCFTPYANEYVLLQTRTWTSTLPSASLCPPSKTLRRTVVPIPRNISSLTYPTCKSPMKPRTSLRPPARPTFRAIRACPCRLLGTARCSVTGQVTCWRETRPCSLLILPILSHPLPSPTCNTFSLRAPRLSPPSGASPTTATRRRSRSYGTRPSAPGWPSTR